MTKKNKLLCLIIIIIINACNDNEKKSFDNIYFRYLFTYDANIDMTTISAFFYIEEKQDKKSIPNQSQEFNPQIDIPLEKGSTINFNNSELQKLTNGSVHQYTKVLQGFIDGGTFVWKDVNGKELINNVTAPNKIGFPQISSFNKNFEIFFKYTGEPLNSSDFATFSITDSRSHEHFFSILASDSSIVQCPVNQTYSDGLSIFKITRETAVVPQQQGKAGGEITLTYIGESLSIDIVSKPTQSDPPSTSNGKNPF